MGKNSKKSVENQEVNNVANEIINEAQSVENQEVVAEKSELEAAQDAVAKAKEAMAEAKKKLAEAKKSAIKTRPVRSFYFQIYVDGSWMSGKDCKGGVHYCVEKCVIDILNESIKNNENNDNVYEIYKRNIANEDDITLIETLKIDHSTKQIIID